ncbi:hypothetical protein [Nocardioides aquiterrae]|uniref:DUF2092 domain-containing protein n=1 Tax=Nocardioides aquiterrae TaxID=203799 RepID=A0ABP4EVG9_9ACTN
MSLTERLREELEESFAGEPAHRPVDQRIAEGHRALRRRRLATAAVACGVMTVLGATWAIGSPGSERDAGRMIATEPPAPSGSAAPTASWEDDTPVRYLDGELQIRSGVVVHERIENPYDYQLPKDSVALDLTYEGQRQWLIAETDTKGYGYSSSVPSNGWASFRAWVDDQVAAAVGETGDSHGGWPQTMRLAGTGEVDPTAGTEVLQRTDDPRLGPDFAPPGAKTGAAVVQVRATGRSYFVVWRVIDGKLDVITTPPRDVVGATFDELLTYARSQYASGEGLR